MGEQHDQPLDLAPVAEMDVVAEVAAAIGPRRRLIAGIGAEGRDQLRRILIALSIRKIWHVHATPDFCAPFAIPYQPPCQFGALAQQADDDGEQPVSQVPQRDRRAISGRQPFRSGTGETRATSDWPWAAGHGKDGP